MRLIVLLLCLPWVGACSSHGTGDDGDAGSDASMAPTRPAATVVVPSLIGTGGFGYAAGSAFPGAAAPQGLCKVGPDTSGPWGNLNFLHCAGYWYGDDTVQGISHMHLHGTGVPDYGVLAMMPVPAFSAATTSTTGYQSKFDKATESSSPGKYAVTLTKGAIRVESTSTAHAAHHRITYPAGATLRAHRVRSGPLTWSKAT